jgi:hypothetical protein
MEREHIALSSHRDPLYLTCREPLLSAIIRDLTHEPLSERNLNKPTRARDPQRASWALSDPIDLHPLQRVDGCPELLSDPSVSGWTVMYALVATDEEQVMEEAVVHRVEVGDLWRPNPIPWDHVPLIEDGVIGTPDQPSIGRIPTNGGGLVTVDNKATDVGRDPIKERVWVDVPALVQVARVIVLFKEALHAVLPRVPRKLISLTHLDGAIKRLNSATWERVSELIWVGVFIREVGEIDLGVTLTLIGLSPREVLSR